MKKARLKVVGVKSPENSRVSIALRISTVSAYRAAGSAASARRKMSAMGLGSASSSPTGFHCFACATLAAGSPDRPSAKRGWPVSIS